MSKREKSLLSKEREKYKRDVIISKSNKTPFHSAIGAEIKFFSDLASFHNSYYTKLKEVTTKNTIVHALKNISEVKKRKIMTKIIENLNTSGKDIIKDVSKEIGVPRAEVSLVLNSEEFKKLLNKTLPMDTVLKSFKDDFEGRPLDRDKLYEIYTKWAGLDKQVVEMTFNKTPELEAAERILNGESVGAINTTIDETGAYSVDMEGDENGS